MARTERQGIKIGGEGLADTPGNLHVKVYDQGDRVKRALMVLGACWLLAGVTVFIPIAHFILVPGFLIAGPIGAFTRFRQAEARERADGRCPKCARDVTITLDANDVLPKWVYCPACDASIQLKP